MLSVGFRGELWVWAAEKGSWHFVTVPPEESAVLRRWATDSERGFRSVRVTARIRATSWDTSLFPDKVRGGYLLPVKKAVRQAERLSAGETADVELTLTL